MEAEQQARFWRSCSASRCERDSRAGRSASEPLLAVARASEPLLAVEPLPRAKTFPADPSISQELMVIARLAFWTSGATHRGGSS